MPLADEIKEICVKEFLVPFEGTGPMTKDKQHFIAYPDPGPTGLPVTVAWGLTYDEAGNPLQLGELWGLERATTHKARVLDTYLLALLKMSPTLVLEPPRRIAAVLSWVYNCGLGNYRVSTFKKKIDQKIWYEAAEQCKKWDKAGGKVLKGLSNRRKAEANAIIKP